MLKSDKEESICAFQREIKQLRTGETMLENSPVGESRINGLTEKAVKEDQELVRTLKDYVDMKLGEHCKEGQTSDGINGPVIT